MLGAISGISHVLEESDIDKICERCQGYSGADVSNLCRVSCVCVWVGGWVGGCGCVGGWVCNVANVLVYSS